MKKLLCMLLLAFGFVFLFAVCAYAADGIVYTLSEDKKSYILSSYTRNEPEVRIDAEHNKLPVSGIAEGAFSGNISTYKIIIPDSIKTIGEGAFSAMPSLYEFEASGNYAAVNGILFSKDKKTLIRYPQARTGKYTIPKNVSVGAYAFSGCGITEIDASGMLWAGRYAFYASDIKTVTLSSSLSSIGEHAFENSDIEKIVIPGKTSVSSYAFSSCEKLVYADISNASLDGEGIFSADTSLLAVSFPQKQTVLPSLTFAGCTSLVTAPIGKNIKSIGSKAFLGCVNLKYASCGGAAYGDDTFYLCEKAEPDKNKFTAKKQKNVNITLKVGESYTPDTSVEYDLFTSSSNVFIDNGAVAAVFEGEAEVYYVSRRGGDCAVIKISVYDGGGFAESDHPYETGIFKYSYTVPGSPDKIAVTFSSSDMLSPADAIKIRDKNGNLYGTFYGGSLSGKTVFVDGDTVKITLYSLTAGAYGFRISSAVAVSSLTAIKSINIKKTYDMKTTEAVCLSPSVSPANAYPSKLLYVSENPNVAYVTEDGVVYAVNEGQTKITVYSEYYGVKAECTVNVSYAQECEFDYEIKEDGVYITGHHKDTGVCNIPSAIEDHAVVGISDKAFAFCNMTEIHLPDTLLYISPSAFDGASALSGIYISENNAYYKSVNGVLYSKDGGTLIRVPCAVKGDLIIPDSVAKVANGAFSLCFGLKSVELGKSVTEISGGAFINCTNLKRITSNSENFTVIDGVLYTSDRKNLIYFPAGLNVIDYSVAAGTENIGESAFDSAVNLRRLVLPESVVNVNGTALCDALYINEIIVNASNVFYHIQNGALYEGGKLKFVPKTASGSFTVSDGTTKISPYAFYNCINITEVVLPDSVDEIGEYSFGYCSSLDRLYLPGSVSRIGYDAFCGDKNCKVYIPDNAKIAYLSDCRVMCGKNSFAAVYCEENGIPYDYMYRLEYGLYTVYTPVNAELSVTEETDPTVLAEFRRSASQNVKAFAVYLLSDGVKLPAGEYVLFRKSTSSARYYYLDGELYEIKSDALSRYKRYKEYIIELDGDKYVPALTVRTLPDKLEYKIYDDIESDGLTLYYTDEHGITTVVDKDLNIKYDFKSTGEKKVSVGYKDTETEFTVNVIGSSLTGNVKIIGNVKYNETLVADVSDVESFGAELLYQWYIDGEKIKGAEGSSYTTVKEDIGRKISVKVTSKSGVAGELTSASAAVAKASSQPPPEPVVKTADITSVILEYVEGCEYKLSTDKDFTDNNVFEGLKTGETYVFCQRYKETETTEASVISSVSYELKNNYVLSSETYFINAASGCVSLIEPGTTVEMLRKGFSNGDKLTFTKNGEEMSDNDAVGTGCEVMFIHNGVVRDRCVIVITGDVNGDGKITITDYLKIKERIQNDSVLSKEREYASDVNGDGKVTITDYLRLKYCIQNDEKPEQNRY